MKRREKSENRPTLRQKLLRGLQRINDPLAWRERLGGAAFLGPSLLGVSVFFILPFLVVVFYSLIDNPINREFVGLQNFIDLFKSAAFKQAAGNTLTFSAIAVPLAVILSLVLALMLECRIPAKSQLRTFFLSPLMVPVASVVSDSV